MAIPKEDKSSIEANKHTRAFLGLALLMTLIAIGGFWHPYWWPILTGSGDFHWLLHIHGAIFTIWMLLLVAQTGFVYRNRTDIHQLVGKQIGFFWGILIILLGISLSFGRISPAIGREFETLAEFIRLFPIPFGDIVVFAILFGLGIYYRFRPETHKRLMILSTAVLLFAPAGRLTAFVDPMPAKFLVLMGAPLLPAFLAIGHDWWKRDRVHPAYIWGTILIALRGISIHYFFASPGWASFSEKVANEVSTVIKPLL